MKTFQEFVDKNVEELNETPRIKEELGKLEPADYRALREAYYDLADGIEAIRSLRLGSEFTALNAELDKIKRNLSKVGMSLGRYL